MGVSREDLERVVEKVDNSAASVRKELAGMETSIVHPKARDTFR